MLIVNFSFIKVCKIQREYCKNSSESPVIPQFTTLTVTHSQAPDTTRMLCNTQSDKCFYTPLSSHFRPSSKN